jgi:SAM-dependent methyltransferase
MKKLLSSLRYVIEQSVIHPLCRIGVKLLSLIVRFMLSFILKVGRPLVTWLEARTERGSPGPNLEGSRHVEWSWILSHLGTGSGEALDFGCGNNLLSFIAARKGYNVTAIDLESVRWPYILPNMRFLRCDILKSPFTKSSFDLIINCSSIEHVGLPGRFEAEDNPEGDIAAMALMRELLRPGGVMLLTIPVGRDAVFVPLHRVYGRERLPRLLNQWLIEKQEYWVKDDQNRWIVAEESAALDREPTRYCYGLGLFVLRK